MSLESDTIQQMLEEEVKALAGSKGEELARHIWTILLGNLDRGRLQYFVEGDPDRLHAYAWRVAEKFTALNPYLHQLQVEQSHSAWEPLFERMQTWAYNYFLRKGFIADDNTRETAIECATEAAVTLIHAYFPYDTDFDPWAHIIVQNTCRKFIQRNLKKSVVPEGKKVELDENLTNPNDLLLELHTLHKESAEELAWALDQLSEARRTVIQSIYFDEREPEEIAGRLGKSVGAIYSLQFNALKDLRKILSENRDNLHEE